MLTEGKEFVCISSALDAVNIIGSHMLWHGQVIRKG